jgi:hypothetical protein
MKCSGLEDRMGRYMSGSRRLVQRWRVFQGLFVVDVDDVDDVDDAEMEGVDSGGKRFVIRSRFSIWSGVRVIESKKA